MRRQRPDGGLYSVPGWGEWQARVRTRLLVALAFSLALHALIISLELGYPGLGLPGLALPWAERRVQAPDLTVRLEEMPPPRAVPEPKPPELVKPRRAEKGFEVRQPPVATRAKPLKERSAPRRKAGRSAPAAVTPAPKPEIPPQPQRPILAQDTPAEETFNVPPQELAEPEQPRAPQIVAREQVDAPAPEQEAREARRQAEIAREKEEAKRQEEEAQRLALEEARKAEADETRRKAEVERRQEEAKKQEEARLALEEAAARQKAEAERKTEETRRLALEAEALKLAEEAARQRAAARQKELEAQRRAEEAAAQARANELAERQRAAAEAAARAEREALAARTEPARPGAGGSGAASPAPGTPSGVDIATKALGQLRAPAAASPELPRSPSRADSPRRRSIFGVERDVVLRMYVDSWRTKIERNGPLNYRRSAGMRAPDFPVVTVAIRSDGTLEHVHIHRSSGLRELDEAVRRISHMNAPYSTFPPALAGQYDVIEIRRVWQFEETLRIVEEMR